MIRHIWSVLCSQSVKDAESQNISLFNVIEQLQVTLKAGAREGAIPRLLLPLELITLWERGEWELDAHAPGDVGRATVLILDPTGRTLARAEMTPNLSEHMRCRSRLQFDGMPITISGRYVVQVSLQEASKKESRVVAEVPVEVYVALAEAEPVAGDAASADRTGE